MDYRQMENLWKQLRGQKPRRRNHLQSVILRQLHGIQELRVPLDYPVCVLAGANACGKTTVLFAAACAYQSPEGGRTCFPSEMFPRLNVKATPADAQRAPRSLSDQLEGAQLEFEYLDQGLPFQMRWSRGKNWNRNFFGRKNAQQPSRTTFLRTLANLTNPSEVKSAVSSRNVQESELSSQEISLAARLLPHRYERVHWLDAGRRTLLFAEQQQGHDSEFHMSAGERSILRLFRELYPLRDALVLIDEIEAGLHPSTQRMLMLELQRLALRNDLQIVVTTHSLTILECVPEDARIFMERVEGNVELRPTYRDIIQRAFYGASLQKLHILCEDEIAEGLLQGCLDILAPKLRLRLADVEIGHDSSKDEFPKYVKAFARTQQLEQLIFVLDGDARDMEDKLRAAAQGGGLLHLLFLPGDLPPEAWIWECLGARLGDYAAELHREEHDFRAAFDTATKLFEGATDRKTEVVKNRLEYFAGEVSWSPAELCRSLGRLEARDARGRLRTFVEALEESIHAWRTTAAA